MPDCLASVRVTVASSANPSFTSASSSLIAPLRWNAIASRSWGSETTPDETSISPSDWDKGGPVDDRRGPAFLPMGDSK